MDVNVYQIYRAGKLDYLRVEKIHISSNLEIVLKLDNFFELGVLSSGYFLKVKPKIIQKV